MLPGAAFHLGLHCFSKYLLTSIEMLFRAFQEFEFAVILGNSYDIRDFDIK